MSQNKIINQGKIKKSEDEKAIFFSTNPYWERRERENKERMDKIIKEETSKKMKEVKQYPNISESSEEIVNILKRNPNDRIEMANLYKPKKKNINLYERINHNLADYLTINRIMELRRNKAIEKIKDIKSQINEEEDKIEEPPTPIPQNPEIKFYDNIYFKNISDETRKNLSNIYNEKNIDLVNTSQYPFYNKTEISYVNNIHQPLITDKRNDIYPAKIFSSYSKSSKDAIIKCNSCKKNKKSNLSKKINYSNKIIDKYHKNRIYDNDLEIKKKIGEMNKKSLTKEKEIVEKFKRNNKQILKFETFENNKDINNRRLQDLQSFQSFIDSFNSNINEKNNLQKNSHSSSNINNTYQISNFKQCEKYNDNNYYAQFLNQSPNKIYN